MLTQEQSYCFINCRLLGLMLTGLTSAKWPQGGLCDKIKYFLFSIKSSKFIKYDYFCSISYWLLLTLMSPDTAKLTHWHVYPVKTQIISLHIHSVARHSNGSQGPRASSCGQCLNEQCRCIRWDLSLHWVLIYRNFPKFSDRQVWANSAERSSLIRVYTVCDSLCIFWIHYSKDTPSCSTFRVIFLGVRIFRKFTVLM